MRRKYGFMAQLSPKQYIQTKARSLPIYKCYLNKDWETAKMAQVIVMRRHVNGNITAGVYLVDLLCLGIKDTMFIFNENQAGLDERFGDEFKTMFEEVDYNLAHNIVYAGHDFALEFEIKPHADFAITKFILEDDNDDIPLVDIEVGEDDKPHLIVNQAGQYGDALAKLKKIAGEGNYYYTIGGEFDEEDEDDEFSDDEGDEDDGSGDESYYDMDEFDLGEITPLQARFIYADDLLDADKVAGRAANEIMTLETELALRGLKEAGPNIFAHDEDYEGAVGAIISGDTYASGVNSQQEDDYLTVQEDIIKAFAEESDGKQEGFNNNLKQFMLQLLQAYKGNPLVVANIFECALFSQEAKVAAIAKGYLEDLAPAYPLAKLTLAFAAYISGDEFDTYQPIIDSASLGEVFPDKFDFGEFDVTTYSLMQTLVSLADGEIGTATRHYYIAAETEVFSWMLPVVQVALMDAVEKAAKLINQGADDEGDEDNDASVEPAEGNNGGEDDKPTLRIV